MVNREQISKVAFFCFGGILLAAAVFKFQRICFSIDRAYLFELVTSGVVTDAMFGGLLFLYPGSIPAARACAGCFLFYAIVVIYKMVTNESSCECFGTPMPLSITLSMDALATAYFLVFGFRGSSSHTDARFNWNQLLFGLVSGLTVVVATNLVMNVSPSVKVIGLAEQTGASVESGEHSRIDLKIQNQTRSHIRLVGFEANCGTQVINSEPIDLNSSGVAVVGLQTDSSNDLSSRSIRVFVEEKVGEEMKVFRRSLTWCRFPVLDSQWSK